jgi:hypothetical protein
VLVVAVAVFLAEELLELLVQVAAVRVELVVQVAPQEVLILVVVAVEQQIKEEPLLVLVVQV